MIGKSHLAYKIAYFFSFDYENDKNVKQKYLALLRTFLKLFYIMLFLVDLNYIIF